MRLMLTQVLGYRRGLRPAVDAVAIAEGEPPGNAPSPPGRYFLPGLLPCGECPLCRRALVGACLAPKQVIPIEPGAARAGLLVEAPDRFVTPIDEVTGPAGPLLDAVAVGAGLVATALGAMATVGAAPGDEALWLGGDAVAAVGAALAGARGLKSRQIEASDLGAPLPSPSASAAPTAAHGRSQQLLFVTRPEARTLRLAAAVATSGCVLLLLSDGAFTLEAGLT